MKAVSIINYKGGVGKTTITANLAADLAHRGKRVLAIDLDPQTNLTFSFVKVEDWIRNYERTKTIKNWFDSIVFRKRVIPGFKDLIIPVCKFGLISSHLALVDIDLELAASLRGTTPEQNREFFLSTFSYIKEELKKLRNIYDIVLFDCPPNFSIVTRNAIVASDYYIIPAKMDFLSTLGINQLQKRVDRLTERYNQYCMSGGSREIINPVSLGVVATMISVRNNEPIDVQKYYIDGLKRQGIEIFKSQIRENKLIYSDAPESGYPVVLKSKRGVTYNAVIQELKSLTDEFIKKAGILMCLLIRL